MAVLPGAVWLWLVPGTAPRLPSFPRLFGVWCFVFVCWLYPMSLPLPQAPLILFSFSKLPKPATQQPQWEFWERESDNKTLPPDLHIYLTLAFWGMQPADTLQSEWLPFSHAGSLEWRSHLAQGDTRGSEWQASAQQLICQPASAAVLEFGTNAWTPALGRDGVTGVSGGWVTGAASGSRSWPQRASSRLPGLKKRAKSTGSSLVLGA